MAGHGGGGGVAGTQLTLAGQPGHKRCQDGTHCGKGGGICGRQRKDWGGPGQAMRNQPGVGNLRVGLSLGCPVTQFIHLGPLFTRSLLQ